MRLLAVVLVKVYGLIKYDDITAHVNVYVNNSSKNRVRAMDTFHCFYLVIPHRLISSIIHLSHLSEPSFTKFRFKVMTSYHKIFVRVVPFTT